ncbi:MAG TPA: hypothetical protein VJZ27_10975, partial [Aggregatilineales bacterium]|nr:hypothetical protein [Aggregatilineales bacterium]
MKIRIVWILMLAVLLIPGIAACGLSSQEDASSLQVASANTTTLSQPAPQSTTVAQNDGNNPPTVGAIPARQLMVGEEVSIRISAIDPEDSTVSDLQIDVSSPGVAEVSISDGNAVIRGIAPGRVFV